MGDDATDKIIEREQIHDGLIDFALTLVKGGKDFEYVKTKVIGQASLVLDFDEGDILKDAHEITEKAHKIHFNRKRGIAEEVKFWIDKFVGAEWFSITQIYQDLGIIDPRQKKAVNMFLLRLVEKEVLEKHKDKNALYRKIQNKKAPMKFNPTISTGYPLWLPFGLGDILSLYPKNVIVVAGFKSAGKTAFLMETLLRNQNRKPCVYLNSEMGEEEWSLRLLRMGITSAEQIKFEAYECAGNFHDMVTGEDKIFFIDYIPTHDKFYLIGDRLQEIHEKLDKGVAIVSIQKDKYAEYGRGGVFSLEVCRLYLTLDFMESEEEPCSLLKIKEAKFPKSGMTLANMGKRIKILDKGARMEALDRQWKRYGKIEKPVRGAVPF